MQHIPWQQFLIVLVAFGAPAASWAFGKLREQYEKKRLTDASRAREEESIRVQRSAERLDQPSPQTLAQRRIEELGARRQAQLEELRRRRAGITERASTDTRPVVAFAPTQAPTARTPPQGPMRPGVPGAPMRMPGLPNLPTFPTPARRPGVPQQSTGQGPRPGGHPPQSAAVRQRPPARPAVTRTQTVTTPEAKLAPAQRPLPPAPHVAVMTGAQHRAFTAAKTPGALARAMLIGKGAKPTTTVATAFALTEILSKPVALRGNPFDDRAWL